MKRIFSIRILFLFIGIFFISSGFSQVTTVAKTADPFQNPVILSHYTVAELQSVSPKKLLAINYYYTESFIIEMVTCSDCVPYDKHTFDIAQLEHFRKKSERYVRENPKCAYKVTLLSKDEMLYECIR